MKIPIYHFFHVYFINHWEELVRDHIKNLTTSGLYDEMEQMVIGAIGSVADYNRLSEIIKPYAKIVIQSHSEVNQYEFLTLSLLKRMCDTTPLSYVYYSHSKGCSYSKATHSYVGGRTWFDYMEYFNCLKWKNAVKVLDFGYDCYGIKAIPKRVSPSETLHFSGNSWWCNSEYIKSLPPINKLDISNRFGAETLFVGQNSPLMFTACQLFVDYICTTPFEDLLKGGHVKELI